MSGIMNRTLTSGVGVALAIGIFSCSDKSLTGADNLNSDDLSSDAARIATVTVSLASSSIAVGDSTQATATLQDSQSGTIYRTVTWSSGNTAVATVSSTGVVTGVAPGTAVITASRAGKTGSATITVTGVGITSTAPVASVSVSLSVTTLNPGQFTQAIATTYDLANNVLTGRAIAWSSSNTAVATIDAAGVVTAVAAGTAQIIATSEGKSGSATLTVNATSGTTANPGTVTDLKVSAIDSTGVTLTFTQVNDGTGKPAQYDVRYSVAPISWGSATSATSGTCAVPVMGTAIGSPLTCTVLGLRPATSYQFQLIAFRGTLNYNAVFGGLSNVVAATTTSSASSSSSPPPGSYNEPAGMTFIDQRPFNSLQEHAYPYIPSWDTDNTLTIVQDATAPISPSNVIRVTYPTGFVAGSAPGHAGVYFGPTGYKTFYIRFAAKLSLNFYGQQSSYSKFFYVWQNNSSLEGFYFAAHGTGTDPLEPDTFLQGITSFPVVNGTPTGNLAPNLVPTALIIRGQWQIFEFVLVGNSAGTADGSVDWYVDGVHVGSVGGIQWTPGAATFSQMDFRPVWGGAGGTVPATMTMDWDHVYMSGKN